MRPLPPQYLVDQARESIFNTLLTMAQHPEFTEKNTSYYLHLPQEDSPQGEYEAFYLFRELEHYIHRNNLHRLGIIAIFLRRNDRDPPKAGIKVRSTWRFANHLANTALFIVTTSTAANALTDVALFMPTPVISPLKATIYHSADVGFDTFPVQTHFPCKPANKNTP